MKNFLSSIFRIIKNVFFILVVAVIVSFAFNNRQSVTMSLFPFPLEVETRLFLLILFCFFGGILVGFLSCSASLTKEKFRNFLGGWKIKSLSKKVEKQRLKEEIALKKKMELKNGVVLK